jgi:hypothetical protein
MVPAARSRTFLPLDTKQCDKMLEYEKGYKEKQAGFPRGTEPVRRSFSRWGIRRAPGEAASFRSRYGTGGGATGVLAEGV